MARKPQDPEGVEPPGFEEQLARLETLLAELESGRLALEEGVERYREGVALLRALNVSLGAAERKVEELTASLRRELEALEGGGAQDA
jgi:exodeoxyribonuclease VII small subunit